jgi:hypothetical protein
MIHFYFKVLQSVQDDDLQLGVLECKAYHDVLIISKSQVHFDCLLQIHALDMEETSLGNIIRYSNTAKKGEWMAVHTINFTLNGMTSTSHRHVGESLH